MQLNLAVANDRIAPWSERLPLVCRLLEEEQIDVLIAQAGDTQAGEAIMAGVKHLSNRADHAGQLILSTMPIAEQAIVPLSRLSDTEDSTDRALLVATIEGVRFVNAHWSWVPDQAAENVRETLDYLDDAEADLFLVGDFNQAPSSPAMQSLAQAGFIDCWTQGNLGQAGYTFPADMAASRIDYVLARSRNFQARGLRTVGAAPTLSDHLGLVAELAA